MPKDLSDRELVKKARGSRTKSEFARLLGVSRPLIAAYERGAAKPSTDILMKMAEKSPYPWNVYCWRHAKLTTKQIGDLLLGLRLKDEVLTAEREQIRRELFDLGIYTEPVTEPLGDEPVGGESASLKGLSKTVEEFWARNPGIHPGKRIAEEAKPPAPAKKAKRERRCKK